MNTDQPTSATTSTPSSGFSRRSFLQRGSVAGLAAAALGSGAALISSAPRARGDLALDLDILNFALNLEYLEAQYYHYAVFGTNISTTGTQLTGTGTLGGVTIKSNPKVPFSRDRIRQYATEIAIDENNHVKALRSVISSYGGTPVAQPALNLRESFNTLAVAAGIIPAGGTFDPFLNDKNFLLGGFIFEDVGVTAYRGAAPLIENAGILGYAASILAVEAYHAGSIRSQLHTLYLQEGLGDIPGTVLKISNLRDTLSGPGDDDQEIVVSNVANIVPTDSLGLVYPRTTRQVLNIVYGAVNATSGLFFPAALNGDIKA